MDSREKVKELARQYDRIEIAGALPMIYEEARASKPKLVVELGVSREALANKVLAFVAEENEATFVSCDLYDFSDVCKYPRWYFYQVEARALAVRWRETCADLQVMPKVDLLFVDLDEKYETTRGIVPLWGAFLKEGSPIMVRCTNLKKELIYSDGRREN